MAREQVQVIGFSKATPDAVWSIAREFCGMWHPVIKTMRAEYDSKGALIRAFTARGEDTVYRERLTYFSDSDRTLAYSHVEGIAGVDAYAARMVVSAAEQGGSVITLSATLSAPAKRAAEIASGTKAIFQDAVAALAAAAEQGGVVVPIAAVAPPVRISSETIDELPRLAIDVTPAKDGPLVLFLHGIGGGRVNWARQLGAVGHLTRAAALDLRGYGASSLGPQQSNVDDYCADILRVADLLGAKKLILVGLSYGSWIATSFAMRHPDRLAGLVLSGGCTGMSEAGPAEREAFRVSREVPLNAGQVPADFAPQVVNVIAGPGASEAVRAELFASMAAIPAATYRDALICFTNPLERFDFSRLTMPVLMMTGEHDRLAPPSEIRAVAERIFDQTAAPDVQYETIPGVGHVCNVEGSEAYNCHLTAFVARLLQ